MMARPLTGQIEEHPAKDGHTYRSLRFRAYGKRHRLPLRAVTHEDAERQLRHVLADIERGVWKPPARATKAPAEPEGAVFHKYAEQWWLRYSPRLAAGTQADYRGRLECHLLPYFGELSLDAITYDTVERYIAGKLAGNVYDEGREVGKGKPLAPRTINMTLTLLAAILETAVERGLIARNPARGRGRRVRERKPERSYLRTASQIQVLLDAAGDLDKVAPASRQHVRRRAMLATLTFAGLRISEVLALRWRDVDLASGWLSVAESKTDAGTRMVKIRGSLRDELLAVRAEVGQAEGLVFPTSSGRRIGPDNFRNRILATAVKRADEKLAAAELPPLPEGLTPHSLRRTFASLLYALGESPRTVMDELGHADEGLALRVYAQTMRRDGELVALRALVEGAETPGLGQPMCQRADSVAAGAAARADRRGAKSAL